MTFLAGPWFIVVYFLIYAILFFFSGIVFNVGFFGLMVGEAGFWFGGGVMYCLWFLTVLGEL